MRRRIVRRCVAEYLARIVARLSLILVAQPPLAAQMEVLERR